MDIDRFVEIKGSYVHIGTEQDLYNILNKQMGTDFADSVVNFYKWSYDNYNQYTKLQNDFSNLLESLEISESDNEDFYDALTTISCKIRNFEDSKEKDVNKLIKSIKEIIERSPI